MRGGELKDRVPDKDILGSPLRFEDLRFAMNGDFVGEYF
jgi:hypothetical protein